MNDPSFLRILIVTPAAPGSRIGNRTTADRWGRILEQLGHRVTVCTAFEDCGNGGDGGEDVDVMIALHAWHSADSIRRFRAKWPKRCLIVGLAGTDVNEYLQTDSAVTLQSLDAADFLVGLHHLVSEALPENARQKLRVIYQSAGGCNVSPNQSGVDFDICVIAHLRDVKDPLRAAEAARRLPASSTIQVTHLGGARDAKWDERAHCESGQNARFHWKGEVTQEEVWQTLQRCKLMVNSSRAEGGANAISEAMAAGVPILASHIPGNVGILGEAYPGYFPVGDTDALANLMLKAERDSAFLAELQQACNERAHLFTLEHETAVWKRLIAEIASAKTTS